MNYIFVLLSMFYSSFGLAGGSSSGGTPPALSDLNIELMQAEPGRAGLFDNGTGDIGLLAKGDLFPKLIVGKNKTQSLVSDFLLLPEADFHMLRDRAKPIDTMNTVGLHASYKIEAGNTGDSMILIDRREAVRAAVQGH